MEFESLMGDVSGHGVRTLVGAREIALYGWDHVHGNSGTGYRRDLAGLVGSGSVGFLDGDQVNVGAGRGQVTIRALVRWRCTVVGLGWGTFAWSREGQLRDGGGPAISRSRILTALSCSLSPGMIVRKGEIPICFCSGERSPGRRGHEQRMGSG